MEISVVLPTYNEEKNLITLLPFLQRELSNCAGPFEIIVIDGGSTDKTAAVSRDLGAKVIVPKDHGFGNAIKTGFEAAKGRYIITMDADNSHPPDLIRKMVKSIEGADLVIGSRFINGAVYVTDLWRKVVSTISNKIFKAALSLPVHDLSSGFKIYRKRILEDIDIKSEDFDVQLELLIKIISKGGRVKEIPLVYKKRLYGYSKVRTIKCGWAFLRTFFKMYRLRKQHQ